MDVLSKGQVGRSKEADPKADSSERIFHKKSKGFFCGFFFCFFYLFTGDLTTGAGGQTRDTGEFTEKCFPYFVLQS